MQHRLLAQRAFIADSSMALKTLVLNITPAHLHSHLKDHPRTISVDVSPAAVCVVVQIQNSVAFMQSMLPMESARVVTRFISFATKGVEHGRASLHLVRTLADGFVLVSGLFNSVGEISRDEDLAASAVRYALSVQTKIPASMDVAFGIARAPLVGMPLGNSCVRYDIFGPAVSKATALASSAECANSVNVDYEICAALGDRLVFDAKDPSASESVGSGNAQLQGGGAMVLAVRSISPPSSLPASLSQDASSTNTSVSFDPSDVLKETRFVKRISSFSESGKSHTDDETASVDGKLTVERQCCCIEYFVDGDVEAACAAERRKTSATSFALINGAMVVVLGLTTASVAEEKAIQSRFPSLDGWLMVFFVLNAFCAGMFAVIAMRCRSAPVTEALHMLCFFTMLVAQTCCHFARRSAVGDDPGFLLYVVCLASINMGANIRLIIVFQVLACILYYIVLLEFRVLFAQVQLLTGVSVMIMLNAAVTNDTIEKSLFANLVACRRAVQEATAQKKIHNAVYAAVIPAPLQHLVNEDALSKRCIDTWPTDETVVVHVSIVYSSWLATLSTSEAGGREIDLQAIKEYAEQITCRIETIVAACAHRSLDIVRVFGGDVVVAGPLQDGNKRRSGVTIEISDAVADAMQMAHGLLSSAMVFSAGIACEQSINSLRLVPDSPSFGLVGPVTNIAKALASASPVAPMDVATEHFTQYFERECKNMVLHNLVTGAAESWRLRNLGSVRVCTLKLGQERPLLDHSLTSK